MIVGGTGSDKKNKNNQRASNINTQLVCYNSHVENLWRNHYCNCQLSKARRTFGDRVSTGFSAFDFTAAKRAKEIIIVRVSNS